MRSLLNIRREDSGAATIELALVAPFLATLCVGVADISIAYGKKLELEQGAQRAIEKVMQTTGEDSVEDAIKKEALCQINGQNADGTCAAGTIASDDVDVTFRLECDGALQTDYDLECPPAQEETRYISVTVTDNYTPMFPVKFGVAADGTYHLSTTAGVRVK
jgi:Flp pilus assembly protein TadG